MHRITDNRMTVDPHLHFNMFSRLCGDNAIQNVILVTTMWGNVQNKPDLARGREQELRSRWWKTMLNFGSSIERFDDTFDSAWTAIDVAIRKAPPDASAVKEDLDALQRRLPKNKAGTDLYKQLETLINTREETLRKLKVEAKKAKDAQQVQELNAQCEVIQEELRKATDQLNALRIPIGQRFLAFFGLPKKWK
jgi:tRNA U34 5-carboxymethylaminomethyl modifying GTPase MnmE/TrmE